MRQINRRFRPRETRCVRKPALETRLLCSFDICIYGIWKVLSQLGSKLGTLLVMAVKMNTPSVSSLTVVAGMT